MLEDRIARAKSSLITQIGTGFEAETAPEIGIILGSGLGDAFSVEDMVADIQLATLDGMPAPTAPGHAAHLTLGTMRGRNVAVLAGRYHLYEGHGALDVCMPVYLMAELGVRTLIITNAAGGLNPAYEAGDIAIIRDHINLTGQNPLIGVDAPSVGVRFPDLSNAYDRELRAVAKAMTAREGLVAHDAIYAAVTGPSLETSAERRAFHMMGADLIGMSTALEVIAANHAGLSVLGVSAVTNKAHGGVDQPADTIEDVLAHARIAGTKIARLVHAVVPEISA